MSSNNWYVPSENIKRATGVGLFVGVIALIGIGLIGDGSGAEAIRLIEAMLPSVRFFCSAVMTATATILALMLTILTFGQRLESELDNRFYDQIQEVAQLDTIVFIAASFLLLFISVPIIEESDFFSSRVYLIFYYMMLVYTAALWGTLAVVVLRLLNALKSMISLLHPEHETNLIREAVKEH